MKKFRKSIYNVQHEELEKAVTLKVYTKCPTKYILIDEETGQAYRGREDAPKGDNGWALISNRPSALQSPHVSINGSEQQIFINKNK